MNIIKKLGITKAPWYINKEGSTNFESTVISTIKDGESNQVGSDCEVLGHSEWLRVEECDLRLMSYAPEMLEALIRRVQTDYIYVQCGEIDFRDIEADVKIIEKATGKAWEEIKALLNDND